VEPGAGLEKWVVLGAGCRVEAGALLEECVVWNDTAVKAGSIHHRAILAGELEVAVGE